MSTQKDRAFKPAWRKIAGAAVLCATLFIGQQGFASAASGTATNVAAPAAQAACTPSGITTGNVNMRTGPSTNNPIITVVPINTFVNITGRNADRSWYQIVFNGQQGWVSVQFLRVSCVQGVPVVNAGIQPPVTGPEPIPPTSNVVTFTASASTINFGQCTVLRWSVPVGGVVLLSYGAMQTPVQLAGTQQVCPTLSTRFYLQVDNGGSRQFFPTDITVVNPQNPANFRSNAYIVTPGQCPTLSWNVENVQGVFLFENNRNPQGVAGNATRQVCVNQSTNFALRVVDNQGRATLTPLTINILNTPPANVVFIATPNTVGAGQCAQLQWIAGNARSVNLLDSSTGSNTRVGNWGDVQVCPSRNAVYTIRAVLADGSVVDRQQTVNVSAAIATPIP
jgi:uncharacterized protein YraI